MKNIATFILSFLSLTVFGQVESKIGTKAPDLVFNRILNFNTTSAKLSDFNNKIVVIEYWGTFCSSCISSFPHLEELQSKFKNDLQVITIASDSEKRIAQFLSKRKLSLPVVIDEKNELATAFPHHIVPHTILIDKDGIVLAITEPSEITEDLISKVINKQKITLKEKAELINFDQSKLLSAQGNINYQVTITRHQDGFSSALSTGENRIYLTNCSTPTLYEAAYKFPSQIKTIIEVADPSKMKWSKENNICFDLIIPDELVEKRFEIMKEQLNIYFGYKASVEKRLRPVKVLRKIKGATINLKESAKNEELLYSYTGGNGLFVKNATINFLDDFVQLQTNTAVVDETNLKGKYDFSIPYFNENPGQLYNELKKLGFELIDEQRQIEVLVIKDNK